MRKINLLLLVIAFIAISCSEDSPTGPSVGKKGIYTMKMYKVPYDSLKQNWDTSNKTNVMTARYNRNISVRKANYDECYGKNCNKGRSDELQGAVLGYYYERGDSTIYKYDNNDYLVEVTYYKGGVREGSRVYSNNNGKLLTNYYATSQQNITYEYGENGYIKNEYVINPIEQIDYRKEYHQDSNGYVVERWFYLSESTSANSIISFSYNNQGLMIQMKDEQGVNNAVFKYNNLGLVSERIDKGQGIGGRTMEYKYNSSGMPIEIVIYWDGVPDYKAIFEYID